SGVSPSHLRSIVARCQSRNAVSVARSSASRGMSRYVIATVGAECSHRWSPRGRASQSNLDRGIALMDNLSAARAAFLAGNWTKARDDFLAARPETPLDADDLSALARASWWLGLMDESLAAWEEVYARHLEAS